MRVSILKLSFFLMVLISLIISCEKKENPADWFESEEVSGGIVITGVSSKGSEQKELIIPAKINGKAVTEISDRAFMDNTVLCKIVLPRGIKNIGWGVFAGCSSLNDISLPDSLQSIGYGAFQGCSNLTSIKIPTGVTSILNWTFADCRSLTSVKIPQGVKEIWYGAFADCSSLSYVEIPKSVKRIGNDTFTGCTALAKIRISSETEIVSPSATSGKIVMVLPSECEIVRY